MRKEDKVKIEKISYEELYGLYATKTQTDVLQDKINEIIDYLNKTTTDSKKNNEHLKG